MLVPGSNNDFMTTTTPVLLAGSKIILRDWQSEDLASYEQWQKPGQAWQKLDGPYYQSDKDESAEKAARVQKIISENAFPSPRMNLVIADKLNNKMLGTVSSYWESKETNWLCIGITIYDPQTWGKGIGAEAMKLWIDYLFENRSEIVRLDMRTWSGNGGLMHLAKKLGFTQEACFRKARIVDGQYYDGLGYGLLRDEWPKSSL